MHLIAVPERQDPLSILLRRAHGRYAQYDNIRSGRTGHLWQGRFFACMLGRDRLWTALAYVDRNPVRAGIAETGGGYQWSSAAAHLSGTDPDGLLDMEWWRREARGINWAQALCDGDSETAPSLRRCTYASQPFGSEAFISEMSRLFGRYWTHGRPKKEPSAPPDAVRRDYQLTFFAD